jgi:hypothetical protein
VNSPNAGRLTNHSLTAAVVTCLALGASPTKANWLGGDALERHCGAYVSNPLGTEAAGCVAFVRGYVAAAGAGSGSVDARDAERFVARPVGEPPGATGASTIPP